jgi:hypothetical protein
MILIFRFQEKESFFASERLALMPAKLAKEEGIAHRQTLSVAT